jgi:hypothetical protein
LTETISAPFSSFRRAYRFLEAFRRRQHFVG